MEWINDGTHRCPKCGFVFKVYGWDDEPDVNFCPSCSALLGNEEPDECKED